MPKIQWVTIPHCCYGYLAMGNLYLYLLYNEKEKSRLDYLEYDHDNGNVNGYTYRRSNQFTCIFIFAFFFGWGQPLKERICSSRSKFFPLRVDPYWKVFSSREGNRKSQQLSAFVKNVETHRSVLSLPIPITLRTAKTP